MCDEYLVDYGSTELGYSASGLFTAEDKSREKQGILRYRSVPGVEIKITDEDGFLQPVEVIQVFGRKIYPVEIENVIKTKSNVIEAIVMPIKNMETGDQVPAAAIIYRPRSEEFHGDYAGLPPKRIKNHARKSVA